MSNWFHANHPHLYGGTLPESAAGFVDEVDPSEKTLLIVNRTGPVPLVSLLERAFENQSVSVDDRNVPGEVDDLVCLVDGETVVATTPMSELEESLLLVNADRSRTGTRQLRSGSFPVVLTGLDETEFTVRGFPESNKEKLLLILISRFIESMALDRDAGTLRGTFQRLSRLDDEYGTRTVYSLLADSRVETHVYGLPGDHDAVSSLDVIVHTGDHEEYRESWFVVFTPPEDDRDRDAEHAALVAVETGPNVWRGTWTYDAELVKRIDSYLVERF